MLDLKNTDQDRVAQMFRTVEAELDAKLGTEHAAIVDEAVQGYPLLQGLVAAAREEDTTLKDEEQDTRTHIIGVVAMTLARLDSAAQDEA